MTDARRLDVELAGHDGTNLPADADAGAPVPGVVMTHGFSATRHMGLPAFAAGYADAGLAVLVYDHRNLGDSDGEPRQFVDPWGQMLDQRAALGWLGARPEVDADRLALWGSSFSGGEVICLAAVDRRVKAVVANVPFAATGPIDATGAEERARRFAAIADVLEGRTPPPTDPPLGPMPVVREPGSDVPGFLDQPESAEWFLANGPGTGWENRVTVQFSADPPFDPGSCIERVAPTPLLMVVASEDRTAPAEMALGAFAAAGEPKQLEVLDGHHFADYQGEGFDRALDVSRRFLVEHLAG
jgi:fermentation-respiration switch protein FrsA (DUF1100 family)